MSDLAAALFVAWYLAISGAVWWAVRRLAPTNEDGRESFAITCGLGWPYAVAVIGAFLAAKSGWQLAVKLAERIKGRAS